jgi:hypothetical protein
MASVVHNSNREAGQSFLPAAGAFGLSLSPERGLGAPFFI